MKQVYLNIDDAVSENFAFKTDILKKHHIPVIFFCRGDRLDSGEDRIDNAAKAIRDGFVLGNHLYSHTRVTTLDFDTVKEELLKTERLLDKAYKKAGVERRYKFMRFPYIDRGCGAFPADKSKMSDRHIREMREAMGLIQITSPLPEGDEKLIAHKEKIQELLKAEGFTNPDFGKVTYSWFKDTEFYTGRDVNFTMATGDSNLLPKYRHKGVTMEDLFRDMDKNFARDPASAEVVVMHDYDQEGMPKVFETIIEHLVKKVQFIGATN